MGSLLHRLCALSLALGVVASAAAPPADAQPTRPKTRLVRGTVRLVPAGSAPSRVSGLTDYLGQIELTPAADGIVVVNRLSLERYLLGLAEVPADWPAEALKAQAVAARTYALHTLARPRSGSAAAYGFDICATVDCQVFSGAEVLAGEDGARWAEAVRSTAGEAVLFGGDPILARYHSTSGGRTFDNEQIFEGEGGYPYLKGVESNAELASPLYRWEVAFTLSDLQRILEAAGSWSGAGQLVEVHTVASSEGSHYPDVVLSGRRGRARMTAEELRIIVRGQSPRLFPAKYPSAALTSSGRLPETFPSNRLEISTSGGVVRVVGRGWGHGVGMSQWGAQGLAAAGASYETILNHYYTGVTLGEVESPGPIEVGVDWGRDVVEVTGALGLVDRSGRTLFDEAVGTWRFEFNGLGSMTVTAPTGVRRPLSVRLLDSPAEIGVGEAGSLEIDLSKPARVTPITRGEGASSAAGEVREAGRGLVTWLAPSEPGRYRVHVEASTGLETESSEPVEIEVTAASEPAVRSPAERAAGDEAAQAPAPWGLLLFALLFAAAGIFAVTGTMRK